MAFPQRLSGFAKGVAFGLLLAATFVAGGALTQDHKPPIGVVEGTEFRIVDKNGTTRGRWTLAGDAVELAMTDQKGRSRVAVLVDDAPAIKFWGEQGQNAIILTQEEARGTWLELSDQTGKGRIHLRVKKDIVGVSIKDAQGNVRVDADCDAAGLAGISLFDETGKPTWSEESKPLPSKKPNR